MACRPPHLAPLRYTCAPTMRACHLVWLSPPGESPESLTVPQHCAPPAHPDTFPPPQFHCAAQWPPNVNLASRVSPGHETRAPPAQIRSHLRRSYVLQPRWLRLITIHDIVDIG